MSTTTDATKSAPRSGSASGGGSSLKIVLALIALGLALALGLLVMPRLMGKSEPARSSTSSGGAAALAWVAAAPGRVEPKSGEIRIGTGLLSRVADVLVKVNDRVEQDELLIRLDDEEARARLAAVEAEAGARRNERDALPAVAGREEVRRAEDAVFSAERAVTGARFELDRILAARRNGTASEQMLADARKRLQDARDRLQRDRGTFIIASSKPNLPTPNRAESALNTARAEVAIAEAVLEKTRIRSPIAGTVLQVHAKAGETVAPAPDQPLIVAGDMSVVKVKAELDEGDVAKVKVGQKAFVTVSGYPGREFEGKVSAMSPSLSAPRIGSRGPRRATDVEVQEVTIDLDGKVPLLPGMRVDAFFRKD